MKARVAFVVPVEPCEYFGLTFAGLPTFVQQNAIMANKNTPKFPRYTLTDQLQQQIRTIAKRLPPMCEEYKTHNQVSGAALIANGHHAIKKAGLIQPVVIGSTYDLPSVILCPQRVAWRSRIP